MALILKVGQSSKGLQLTSNTCTLFLFVHPFAVEECTSACMQTCTTMQFHLIFIILWFISNFVRTHQHNSFSFFNCGVVYQYSICVCVCDCVTVCVYRTVLCYTVCTSCMFCSVLYRNVCCLDHRLAFMRQKHRTHHSTTPQTHV